MSFLKRNEIICHKIECIISVPFREADQQEQWLKWTQWGRGRGLCAKTKPGLDPPPGPVRVKKKPGRNPSKKTKPHLFGDGLVGWVSWCWRLKHDADAWMVRIKKKKHWHTSGRWPIMRGKKPQKTLSRKHARVLWFALQDKRNHQTTPMIWAIQSGLRTECVCHRQGLRGRVSGHHWQPLCQKGWWLCPEISPHCIIFYFGTTVNIFWKKNVLPC